MKTLTDHDKNVWIPDFVAESQGIACGDKMGISAYRQGGMLFFSFSCTACSVAAQSAHFLQCHFSGMGEEIIRQAMERYSQGIFLSGENSLQTLFSIRPDCAATPVLLIRKALVSAEPCNTPAQERTSILACDACVSIRPLLWGNKTKEESKHTGFWKQIANLELPKERLYQRLALCEPQDTLGRSFRSELGLFTPHDLKTVKRLRIAAPLYNNAKNLGSPLPYSIQELAIKQRMSLLVAETETEVINAFIASNGLSIYPVKGGRTKDVYPKGHFRAHMDFDYLAANANDAYTLISYLLNTRGFKLVIGGSVPISLKCIADFEGNEHVTGHIHLEKILQNQYQVVVDINWGGFPLGRTGLVRVQDGTPLHDEDIICITLAHLFKHERAFIKDLNDLYYLLRSPKVQPKVLLSKLKEHRLIFFFNIVYAFLKKTYPKLEYPWNRRSLFATFLLRMDWPFNPKAHLLAKTADLFLRNVAQYGSRQGSRETLNQLKGKPSSMPTTGNTALFSSLNTRTYLYPLAIFNDIYPAPKAKQTVFSSCHGMLFYHDILYLPVGLFLIQKNDARTASRETIDRHLAEILESLGITSQECNHTYTMEARKDLWLY